MSVQVQDISGADTQQSSTTESMCPICLEEFDEENGEVFIVPGCEHKFHESCLRRWKKEKATCPSCRGIMPEELGLTDEHYWIGNQQVTITARPPPEPTFRYICTTALQTPFGIAYSLLIVLSFTILEFLLLLCIVFFILIFAQWYSWVERDDSLLGRIRHSITSILQFPFIFFGIILIWLCHLRVLFSRLGSYYKKMLTCKCRWSDAFSETILPAVRSTEDALTRFMNENQE